MGLVPIEANAAGCPVIAYRDGGALDTVKENVTGLFFDGQNTASLMEAINRFEEAVSHGAFSDRDMFTNHIRQFSSEAFKERILRVIEERKRV